MSQFSQPGFNQPIYQPPPPKPENAVGLTGFIVSLVGLFLCGIPSVIGLIISAVGLRKEPKGFALAGLLISLVGLLELVVFAFLVFSTYRLANEGVGALQEFAVTAQLNREAKLIGEAWEDLDRIPTQEEGEDLLAGKRDINGNSIVYETDGSSFSLRTAGRDGELLTEDDVVVGPFEDADSTKNLIDDFDFENSDWADEIEKQNDEAMIFE